MGRTKERLTIRQRQDIKTGEMRNRGKERALREKEKEARGRRCPFLLGWGYFSVAKTDLRHSRRCLNT